MTAILTLTLNPALDVTTSVLLLEPHVKMRCRAASREPGGGGVNVARAIRALGGESRALIASGGATGRALLDLAAAEDIDCTAVDAPGETRETLQVVDESTGAQYRFVLPGPCWTETDGKQFLESLTRTLEGKGYGWVIASGSLPPGLPDDFYAQVAGIADQHGARLLLDSSGAALRQGVKGPVYLAKPDRAEIADLVSESGGDRVAPLEMAVAMVRRGHPENLIYTQGAEGATVVTPKAVSRWRPPALKVQSLTGAGDAFLAAVVLALDDGRDLHEAGRRGMAAAAATVETIGNQPCARAAYEAMLDRIEAQGPQAPSAA